MVVAWRGKGEEVEGGQRTSEARGEQTKGTLNVGSLTFLDIK